MPDHDRPSAVPVHLLVQQVGKLVDRYGDALEQIADAPPEVDAAAMRAIAEAALAAVSEILGHQQPGG